MKIRTAIKLILTGMALVVCGVAIKLIAHHTSPEQLMVVLRREVENSLNATLDLASARLDLTGTLHLDGVALTLSGQEQPLFRCEKIVVGLDRSELLRRRAVPSKVVLVQPTFNLAYEPRTDSWNFEAAQLKAQGEGTLPAGLLSGGVVLEQATVAVRHADLYGHDEPKTYDGLYLRLARDSASAASWRAEGRFRTGILAGTAVQGWFVAEEHPRYALTVKCESLSTGEDLWRAIPYGRRIWEGYEVAGRLGVEAVLKSSPDGLPRYSLTVTMLDASARSDLFPGRLSSINGVTEVADGGAVIRELTGLIPPTEFGLDAAAEPPAYLRLSGTGRLDGPGGTYRVSVTDFPLCRHSVQAIPEVGPDLWERLRPSGRADLTIALRERDTGGAPEFSGVAELHDVTLHPAEVPRALEGIAGRVVFDTDGVRIENVRGAIGQARGAGAEASGIKPRFVANGTVAARNVGTDLRIAVSSLATDEELVKSIPGLGEQVWESLRPEVILDADVAIRQQPGQDQPTVKARLDLDEGRLSPRGLPMPLEDVSGRVSVDASGVLLSSLRAVATQRDPNGAVNLAHVAANGTVRFDGRDSALEVVVRNVRTSEELLKAIPGAGEDVWELLRPEVDVDAVVLLTGRPEPGQNSVSGILSLHGGRMTPAVLGGLAVDNVSGTVKIDEDSVSLERLAATVDTGDGAQAADWSRCTVEVRGLVQPGAERAELDVAARGLVVTDRLLAAVPTVGELIRQAAQPHGTLSLSGRILYDAKAEEALHYLLNVDVHDASLALEGLPIDAFSGRLLLTEQRAESRDFSGATCGGHFEGALAIRYNAGPEPATYRAQVQFGRVKLSELIARLGGKSPKLSGLISGEVQVSGPVDDLKAGTGEGRLSLTEGDLWGTPFFIGLLNLLHLAVPAEGAPSVAGQASLQLGEGSVQVKELELIGEGLNVSGEGTVGLDGRLALTLVAIGAPAKRTGIPVISSVVGWALQAVERELLRIDVSGSVGKPEFRSQVLSKITWPLRSLRSVLYSPFVKADAQKAEPK